MIIQAGHFFEDNFWRENNQTTCGSAKPSSSSSRFIAVSWTTSKIKSFSVHDMKDLE